MTWGELKKKAEELGIEDDMEVLANGYTIEATMTEAYMGTDGSVIYFDLLRDKYWT